MRIFLALTILSAVMLLAISANAEGDCRSDRGGYCFNLAAVSLDVKFLEGAEIGDIISRIYVFGISLVGISSLVMLVYGGIRYMTAGDKDPTEAKKTMWNAIIGLVLALTSWLILNTINPDLVKGLQLTPTEIKPKKP